VQKARKIRLLTQEPQRQTPLLSVQADHTLNRSNWKAIY